MAYIIAAVIVLSIACFFSIIIGTSAGMQQADFAQGVWPAVAVFPLIGLPVGFLLIIVLLILGMRRRRAAAGSGH